VLTRTQDRHAEIEHFHVPVTANHHVLGLDVAMDDALFVSRTERAGDLQRDVEGIAQWQPPCA